MRQSLFRAALVLSLIGAPCAFAGEDDPPDTVGGLAGFPVSFAPPGARSLGMGGAFVAIADDATAAEANPAGLTILSRSELSVHVGYSDYTLESDNFEVYLWDQDGGVENTVREMVIEESSTDLSFASYVWPFDTWVLSAFYSKPISSQGDTRSEYFESGHADWFTISDSLKVTQESVGLSAAFALGSRFSLGGSLRYSKLDAFSSHEFRIDYWNDYEFVSGEWPSDQPVANGDFSHQDYFIWRDSISGDDSDLTYNIGILINPNGKLSFGVVYEENGEYSIPASFEFVGCFDFGPECSPDVFQEPRGEALIKIPDLLGFGLAWRPHQQVVLAFDANHVTYSDLEQPLPEWCDLEDCGEEPIDDEWDYHLGLEYTALVGGAQYPLSFRAGYFNEPDHDGRRTIDSESTHITLGLGFAVKTALQIDFAAELSDSVDRFLLSAAYRF